MSGRRYSKIQSSRLLLYRSNRKDRQRKTRHLLLESLEDRRVLAALWTPSVNYPLPGAFAVNESSGMIRLDSNTNAAVASSVIEGTAVDAISGVALIESTDFSSSGFGYTLAHSRRFTGMNNTGTNGNGWVVGNQPYLVVYSGGTNPVVAYIESGKAPLLFTITGGGSGSGTWDSHLHAAAKLSFNSTLQQWTLSDAQGNRLTFYDLPRSAPVGEEPLGALIDNPNTGYANQTLFGKIISKLTPGGMETNYAYHTSGVDANLLESITRSQGQIVERFQYTYQTVSNSLGGSARLLSSVTLQRSTGGGPAVDVRTVTYDYYTGEGIDSVHGRLGDLKLVSLREGGSTGLIIRQEYYRYYKQSGFQPGGSPGPTNNRATSGGDPNDSFQTGDNVYCLLGLYPPHDSLRRRCRT